MASKAVAPMTSGYRPEIDITPELGIEDAPYVHSLISVLIYIDKLGRISINVESSMLSSHLVLSRVERFQELLRVFAYIKKHMNSEMVFGPSEPDIEMNSFHCQDWIYSVYSLPCEEIREALPSNMTQSLENSITVHCFVDAGMQESL